MADKGHREPAKEKSPSINKDSNYRVTKTFKNRKQLNTELKGGFRTKT